MDDKLIIRYIMGSADRIERRQMSAWLKESPENMERFAVLKAQYVFSGMPNTILPEKRKKLLPAIVSIAAALFLPLLGGAIYLYIDRQNAIEDYEEATRHIEVLTAQNPGSITYIANPGTKSSVVLPDSSVVRLNGESKLIVPQAFDAKVRELFLSGEGYFEVRHHEDWPMVIHTAKDVSVKVLGTTFDLSAYENDANVKLTLIEGKVILTEEIAHIQHEVKPHQEISIADRTENNETLQPVTEIKRADIKKNTGWVNGDLIFDNTPMPEVVKQLERWYGVNIHVVGDDILNYRFTATFTTESITRVRDRIKFSSMLEYEINGTEIYIRHGRYR